MARDYKGARFHKLVMIARIGPGGSGIGAKWVAQCDCGNTREVVGKDVAAGRLKSCGNCRMPLGKPGPRVAPETAQLRKRYATAVRRATREEVKWDLTPEQYIGIVDKSCSLCGAGPNKTGAIALVNSNGEYTPSNTFPVCSCCKPMMRGLSVLEFLDYVSLWTRHLNIT